MRIPSRARLVPAAAALLLLPALLLLLPSPDSPATPAPHVTLTSVAEPGRSASVGNGTRPAPPPERRSDAVPLPAGVVRVRALYVPGHARAHAELCPARGAGVRLVVLVPSAPAHAPQRAAVRLTWGHAARRADVALAFVLGAVPAEARAALDAEDALYGDIVEGRNADTYGNLTLKTVSMLEWFAAYCPLAARLLKSDDDMFINVDGVLRFAEAPARTRSKPTVWGKIWRDARPVRRVDSKFFVPREEYPEPTYPPYANGPAYLVSGAAVGRLLAAALDARWLRMEDALVTGVAARAAGVARADAAGFLRAREAVRDKCRLRAALAVHRVPYADQFDLWRKLHDPYVKCPS